MIQEWKGLEYSQKLPCTLYHMATYFKSAIHTLDFINPLPIYTLFLERPPHLLIYCIICLLIIIGFVRLLSECKRGCGMLFFLLFIDVVLMSRTAWCRSSVKICWINEYPKLNTIFNNNTAIFQFWQSSKIIADSSPLILMTPLSHALV